MALAFKPNTDNSSHSVCQSWLVSGSLANSTSRFFKLQSSAPVDTVMGLALSDYFFSKIQRTTSYYCLLLQPSKPAHPLQLSSGQLKLEARFGPTIQPTGSRQYMAFFTQEWCQHPKLWFSDSIHASHSHCQARRQGANQAHQTAPITFSSRQQSRLVAFPVCPWPSHPTSHSLSGDIDRSAPNFSNKLIDEVHYDSDEGEPVDVVLGSVCRTSIPPPFQKSGTNVWS